MATQVAAIPTHTDLIITRGNDTNLLITIENTSGVAQNIENDSVTFIARDGLTGTAEIELTNSTGQHTTPESGTTTFAITDAITEGFASATDSTTLLYEVRRTFQAGEEVVYLRGRLRIEPLPAPD